MILPTTLRKCFFVWEGYHGFTAWWSHVNKFHANNLDWHISIYCIEVDPCYSITLLLNAMKNINWYVSLTCSLSLLHFHLHINLPPLVYLGPLSMTM